MKSVVCVKVVPKSEEVRVDPETMSLIRDGVRSEINPPDMNALEMALNIKDRYGGQVNILSMGPPSFLPFLQAGVAMGADHIYLLSDLVLAGADTLATTYTLSKGIRRLGDIDLIFCGEESSDGATGQVPSGLAEWLQIRGLFLTTEMELDRNRLTARGRREVANGYQILEVPLPCVVSVKTACNEPRFMDYARKEWAFERERVTIWNAHDIDADPEFIGVEGSPTVVSGLAQAPTRERKRMFLEGSPLEIAGQIAEILQKNS